MSDVPEDLMSDSQEGDADLDLETWDHFVCAVRDLTRGPRAGLTLAEAHREALQYWIGEMAASADQGQPFQPE
jgi:hypothetical protein